MRCEFTPSSGRDGCTRPVLHRLDLHPLKCSQRSLPKSPSNHLPGGVAILSERLSIEVRHERA